MPQFSRLFINLKEIPFEILYFEIMMPRHYKPAN